MLGPHTKLRQLLRTTRIQQRRQICVSTELRSKPTEWEQSRPFKQIPKVGLLNFVCYMLPGGRYAKMEFPNMMLDLHRRHGPLYRLPAIMGKAEYLVCSDPAHFERVYRAEGSSPERQAKSILDYHRNKHQANFYQGVEGLVSTTGATWSKFRYSVNPILMQPKTIRLYYQEMSNVHKEFIERIREIRDSSTFEVPHNFEDELNRLTLECVSVIALDKQLGLFKDNRNDPRAKKLLDSLVEVFALGSEIELKPSSWLYISTPLFKRTMRVLDTIQELTVGYVNEAVERLERKTFNKPEHKKSVLEKLLKIDKKIATVMAMDMMLVGVDTTASTFAACLLCLAQNPEQQEKLREEVLRMLPEKDSDFTEDSMKNMPYLRACIKEALRHYPLLSANSRIIKSNIVLNGYQIPKDTAIIMLSHGLTMSDENYPRSKEFLPERWLRSNNEKVAGGKCPNTMRASNPFIYLPFGYGPRMCIGKRIVEMELELGIARLVRNFYIEFNHPAEKPFKSLIINVPNIPLKFKFTDVEYRQQICVASTASAGKIEAASECQRPRPYNTIPKVSKAQFLLYMLPGGRYYKKEFPYVMLDLHKRLGTLYRVPGILGKEEYLLTNDPGHFEQVIRAEGPWPERQGKSIMDFHRSQYRKDFYQGVEGIISTDGEMWAKFRFTVNPVMLQPKIVRLYYQKLSDVNKEFIQRIREIRDHHTFEVPENFEEEINRWTLESVSVVALDKQLGLINKNRNDPQLRKLFDSINQYFALAAKIELRPSFWRFLPSPQFKRAMQALDNIQEVSGNFVNEALERLKHEPTEKPEHEKSVLEKLLKIDKKIATVMAMDMIMAGVDTTTSAVTGCLLSIAKNPEKQAKLREEVLRILPNKDSDFTEASINNMPYLRACIKESLRFFPLIPGNSRVIKSDIVLNGYQIPKETAVIMTSQGLHMDDQYFPRSKEFLPERWLRQTKKQSTESKCPNALKPSNPFIYLPFGFGPRMCIGKRIVEMELELGIARLIRNFYIEFNHSTEKAYKSQLISVPNIPLQFKFMDVEY
ncbi:LOW QUALITY PROTEIN: uncharacterized protein LOC133836820 [Drosophila sulfurigaster albostrigata]|uniref:LOW QUALITY PROTEIN: uncharacterized protein LOC133836820 n=1 Tax=Drosophila sulfurigaster albostrigata TaxID=89887 RepID=UPI002D21C8DF|nr:LOW QUALITY PROTEIN: uncharacterized protein LOC133836820 [Drosophila sulfurigaster albostrigata]